MTLAQRLLIPGGNFRVQTGISYGPEARHRLDIYTPRSAPPRASVLFLYGGSWRSGSRALYRFLGQAMTGRGYQLLVADYRLFPGVRYPAFVEDAALAFAWAKANLAAYGGRPERLALMGHSAGAYNAAMVSIDPSWLDPHGLTPAGILATVTIAGPLSFNPATTASTRDIFATAADIEAARPIKLAASGAAGAPPFLFLHGQGDRTVGFHNSRNMADAVNAAGGAAELRLYPGVSHLGIVAAFAWPLRWRAPSLEDVDIFLSQSLPADDPAASRSAP